jgi:hypothetical protein
MIWGCGLDAKASQQDSLVSCENCNEPLDFVIVLEVSGQLNDCHLLQ